MCFFMLRILSDSEYYLDLMGLKFCWKRYLDQTCKQKCLHRVQECIPVGCVPPAHWPTISHSVGGGGMCGMHAPCHACPLPHMPPAMHSSPVTYAPSPAMHTPLACTAPAMHVPCHTHPPCHACPPTTHTPLPRTPPPPCMPPLWTEWLTDMCKNITFANFVCGR